MPSFKYRPSAWLIIASLCALPALYAPQLAHATSVKNIAPADIAQHLRTHPQTVVQFNSPDPDCGFCGRAVDVALEAVAKGFSDDVSFVRVQWSPWRAFPAEVRSMGVVGVPQHLVFKDGTLVDSLSGKVAEPVLYAAKLRALFPTAAVIGAPQAAASAVAPDTPRAAGPAPPARLAAAGPVVLASPAPAGLNPVVPCEGFSFITDRSNIPWAIGAADATYCGLTAVGFYPSDFSGAIAAFKARAPVGLRDHRVPPVHATWLAGADTVQTSGHTEVPGELWWALLKDANGARHVAIGQETHVRLMAALQRSDPGRAAELALGRMQAPFPQSPETGYVLADATPVTSTAYLGGRGAVADGAVRRASLLVATRDPIQGELQLDVEIEGVAQSFRLPLKRKLFETRPRGMIAPHEMNQLVSGRADAAGVVVDCIDAPPYGARVACKMPRPGKPAGSPIGYEVQVFFFGPQSNWAVATYSLSNLFWDGQNGSRSFGTSSGLVVFRVL